MTLKQLLHFFRVPSRVLLFRITLVLCALLPIAASTGCNTPSSSNLAPLAISSFAATPATITVGNSTLLIWSVAGAQSLSVTGGGIGAGAGAPIAVSSSSVSVSPSTTTTYTLTATDPAGVVMTATAVVTVVPVPVIQSFTATPALISNAQSSTLSWTVTGADTLSIDNGIGVVTGNSITVTPSSTTIYTLTATNASGASTAVHAMATVNVVLTPSIVSFTASPAEVGAGLPSTLSWSVIGATSLTLDNGIGAVTGTSIKVNPTATTTYTLTATNSLGTFSVSTAASTTIKVSLVPPPTISSFTSDRPSVGPGATVTLTPVFLPIDGVATIDHGVGTVTSGVPVATPALAQSTTFTLTVTNAAGTVTAQQRVLAGNLTLFAGFPSRAGSQDGKGVLAGFRAPGGIAADASGDLYVADTGNNVIRKVTPDGTVSTLAGTPGEPMGGNDGLGSAAQFNGPSGIAVDAHGNVYVADSNNETIRMITPLGLTSTIAGTAGAQAGFADGTGPAAVFAGLQSLTIDGSGNLYATDILNCNIRKITTTPIPGIVTTVAGPSAFEVCGNKEGVHDAARFNSPNGIAVDSAGNVYVADQNNNTIRRISPDGLVNTLAGSSQGALDGNGVNAKFNRPSGLALDSAGNLYVADSFNYIVRKIDPAANVTTIIGQAGTPDASLAGGPLPSKISAPQQLVADPVSNNLFITFSNHAIANAPY